VDSSSTAPAAPYADWVTAAVTIQDAIDAAAPGDLILVTNGIYQTGGKAVVSIMTNRVAITKAVTVQSVNGPAVTIIQGYQLPDTTNGDGAIRCAYVADGATLTGFTLTGGGTRISGSSFDEQSGGGVWCETTTATVSNCFMVGNSARFGGAGAFGGNLQHCRLTDNESENHGGGAYRSILEACELIENRARFLGGGSGSSALNNCLVTGNSANSGGGIYFSDAVNCTITSNTAAMSGGGAYSGSLKNCILYYNTAPDGNFAGTAIELANCCTVPLPAGSGNITNPPAFLNPAAGQFQLQSNSPCINAGHNGFVLNPSDLDGQPRVQGETVDIGAYEFQNPSSRISYAWLQHNGLTSDGTADGTDADGDGLTAWQEWRCRTDPTDPLSLLAMYPPTVTESGIVIAWQSVNGVLYRVERSSQPAGGIWDVLAQAISGEPGQTTFTNAVNSGIAPFFYRVGVE
jgi:parallel beta-helix repeat protein